MIYFFFLLFWVNQGFSHEPYIPKTPVQVSTLTTQDNRNIRLGFWPKAEKASKKGIIVLLEGMGGFLELYQETADVLSQKGFDVYCLDWPGQGGSERNTNVEMLLHIEDFRIYLNDLQEFMQKINTPVYFFGISMGGHLALRYAHDHPEQIKALILLAPMIEINTGFYPKIAAKLLAECYIALGQKERFLPGYHPHDFKGCVNRFNEKKHGSLSRYVNRCLKLCDNPNLAVGGPSFGWLKAAFESCQYVTNPAYVKDIKHPTLIIAPKLDHLVHHDSQISVCANMPKCICKSYENGHHNILMDSDLIHQQFWQDFEEFMKNFEKLS